MRFCVVQLNAQRPASWAVLLKSTGEVVEHEDRLLLGLTRPLAEEWMEKLEDGPPAACELKQRQWKKR
ncbi:hypothetical protein [Methylopila turkensis]|uniref:Uncharacterized protein n=1 Tax=Methylopila turkensis TaxID=1437816 RepID=A0A9W6JQC3_9HYPH|nr:hypothetical protein [Methylopila turkensis]GLK80414.1 hypothetical protein GCM10008174_21550 [Methylopila turkensis]